jgi:hypothetical protein
LSATRPVLADRHRSHHPAVSQQKEKHMSKPTHIAYIVTDPKEGSDKKAVWREVGAIWPHKNGNGFDLVIPEGLSISGRIVCTERKDKAVEDKSAENNAAAA